VTARLPTRGLVIFTGKSRNEDGIARDLNLTAGRPVHVLFGAGEDFTADETIDVGRGWRIANHDASEAERRHGPQL
jgi:hypothetical protein